MYYTGLDPKTLTPVYVPTNPHEKAMQRALIQYRNPKNYDLVEEALKKAGRTDLIGYDKKCLIRPRRNEHRGAVGQEFYGNRGFQGKGPGKGASGGQGSGHPSRKKKTIRNVHKKRS